MSENLFDQQTPVQRKNSYKKPFQSPLFHESVTPFKKKATHTPLSKNSTPSTHTPLSKNSPFITPFKKQKISDPEYQKLLSKKESLQTKIKKLENQKRILELVHRYIEKVL